jgi:hypothetical protein
VDDIADVHAVVQELVKEALVDRPPAPGGIIPLRWATSSRNPGRHYPVISGRLLRNPQARALNAEDVTTRRRRPIDMAFARLIAHLRAKALRTIDALWHEIGHIHDLFEPAERQNSFTAAGYAAERPPLLSIGRGYLTPFAEVGHRFC